MHDYQSHPLYGLMHPRSIAFWGASHNAMNMGSVQLTQLLAYGYEGTVYPMHPSEKEIQGRKAYARAADLPETPDLAIFILPTKVVPEILEECGQAGVKNAIIVTAGFGEIDADGRKVQDGLVRTAQKYGMRFIGPNCIGVVNSHLKLNTTFFPYDASTGFIGMASQSGSFITQMFTHLAKFGLGFSQALSVGNEAMTDLADCVEYLGQCPDTKVIALYVETIRRGREFFEVAKEVSRTKPIVAYYVGGSSAGKRAALSHTGALAGPDPLYEGIFRQCGIVRARTIEDLFDFCWVLGASPLPSGNGLAVLTHSGGPGAAAADAADRNGLALTDFSAKTVERLSGYLPHTASTANPVDVTFSRNPSDYSQVLPGILLDDDRVHSLFMYLLMPVHRVVQSIRDMGGDPEKAEEMALDYIKSQCGPVAGLSRAHGKPLVGASFCDRHEPFIRVLQEMGVPVLPSPERAVRALAALVQYSSFRQNG
ncbi:MAG: CoA-binding protein [Thermodesulfobacteriota bacterium]